MAASISAIAQYRKVFIQASIGEDDPYTVVQKLMGGVIELVLQAGGHMRSGNVAAKGECISRAMAILNALRAALDHTVGSALSGRLDALYAYMGERLFEANARNAPALLDEVVDLMRTLKSGWDGIPQVERQLPARQHGLGR